MSIDNENSIQVLTIKIGVMSEDVAEIKNSVRDLTKTMEKVVVIEERQVQSNEALGRAFREIEKLNNRVSVLEQQAPLNKQTSSWVEKALTGAFALAVIALLAKIGINVGGN